MARSYIPVEIDRRVRTVEPPTEEDDTTYLMKSEANKKHLLKAMENVDKGNLIYVDLDEYEKSRI